MQRNLVPYSSGAATVPPPPGTRAGMPAPVRKQPGVTVGPGVARPATGFQAGGSYISPADLARLRQKATGPEAIALGLVGFYVALHTSYAGEILKYIVHLPFP